MSIATDDNRIYPAFALAEPVSGVTLRENTDQDAPLRHRYLNPSVTVPVLVANSKGKYQPDTLTFELRPLYRFDDEQAGVISFRGGPRDWWDLDYGIQDPTIKLADADKLPLTDTLGYNFAAALDEVFGQRQIVVATETVKLGFFAKARRMINITVGSGRGGDGDVITWQPATKRSFFSKTVLADPADLARAITALKKAYAVADAIKVDSYYFD